MVDTAQEKSDQRKRRVGRPVTTSSTTAVISLRLRRAIVERIKEFASKRGVSMSEFLAPIFENHYQHSWDLESRRRYYWD